MKLIDRLVGKIFDKFNVRAFNREGPTSHNEAKITNSTIGKFVQNSTVFINQGETKNIQTFKEKLGNSEWDKQIIKATTVHVCRDNSTYQIEIGKPSEQFNEPWSDVYSDKLHSRRIPVYIKIDGQRIQEVSFVSCDGGRIFVPLPNWPEEEGGEFYWEKDSLEFKLGEIIGEFHSYGGLSGIAEKSKIKII